MNILKKKSTLTKLELRYFGTRSTKTTLLEFEDASWEKNNTMSL